MHNLKTIGIIFFVLFTAPASFGVENNSYDNIVPRTWMGVGTSAAGTAAFGVGILQAYTKDERLPLWVSMAVGGCAASVIPQVFIGFRQGDLVKSSEVNSSLRKTASILRISEFGCYSIGAVLLYAGVLSDSDEKSALLMRSGAVAVGAGFMSLTAYAAALTHYKRSGTFIREGGQISISPVFIPEGIFGIQMAFKF